MPLQYPAAAKVDTVDDYHGTKVADPYRWLEDVDSEQTRAWVAAQNELTFGYLAKLPARERIKQRLTELWDYPKYGAPFEEGGRYFFSKNTGLQNQSVYYVQESLDAEPRVLLDPNTLSEDGTVSLAGLSIARDGKKMAWATSVSGSDWQTWYVRDIDTGQDLQDKIEWSKFSGASWDEKGEGFYYSRYDAPAEGEDLTGTNFFQKLYYHKLGTPQAQDVLVYERPDHQDWGIGGDVTESGDYLIISIWKGTSPQNLLFYKDLRDPAAKVVEMLGEFEAEYGFVEHDAGVFYLTTDLDAPRKRLVAVDTANPAKDAWFELIPQKDITLQGVGMINGDEFVAEYMKDAHSVVYRFDHHGSPLGEVALPGLGSAGGCGGHRADTESFYTFTSFLYPPTIFKYDFKTGVSTVFREPEIDVDLSDYATEQVFYASKDGTKVPMFLVHRKDIELDGKNPTLLYGYGGFNASMTPYFSISRLQWVEMGGVFAMANLRGGGEYGEEWHQGGMLKNKQNVFDDFIAAAEWLIAEKYTSAAHLACQGGSNGGTLVGAVINQRPELFAAALPAVGVMDMLRFHKFTIGWAWTSDYGSSEDPEMFPVLRAYSPYHNLKDGTCYPATLVTTADHDDRVVPGHSFKYAARIQEAQGCDNPVLIRIETKAGHGGGKPTAKIIEEVADEWAFLAYHLGMQ
ncbi:MAG: prolyl oligopeptidase family serine peptidase [Candidatus Latescibacteria bacterium]|nr:prolyl oligopeptidase family serine peptidase [Candidatus Latescibacterota bacterium]